MELVRGLLDKPCAYPLNAADMLALPVDTPYGNLSLKSLEIQARLAHANIRLKEAHSGWKSFTSREAPSASGPSDIGEFAADEAIFMLRRVADELIGTLSLLTQRSETGKYPDKVAPDSIGPALKANTPLVLNHHGLATTVNNLANAHKHSFLDSEAMMMIGRDEPCVIALALDHNNLKNQPTHYVVSLDALIRSFNEFLKDALHLLRELARQIQQEENFPKTT